MIYGYIRVSTDHQTTENQRFEIKRFCAKQDLAIDCWIEETISATKDLNKRKLGRLLRRIQKDDLIIASELSRLGRNLLQVMSILHHCMDVGAKIWTIKDNYRLGSDITSKVLAFAFGLSAEIERNLISQRTKEALARVKAEGKHIGRPMGSRNESKLAGRERYISQKLEDGRSKYEIARRLRVHRDTLQRFIEKRDIGPGVVNGQVIPTLKL
ncbi:MAG: master DNA invertase Mpi family serine-type recombinase [Alphaproteobacteria bacterium]|nr:master DNA invertase Mpi family serine-type recombinase [Alphaproteobacteria bacterium]